MKKINIKNSIYNYFFIQIIVKKNYFWIKTSKTLLNDHCERFENKANDDRSWSKDSFQRHCFWNAVFVLASKHISIFDLSLINRSFTPWYFKNEEVGLLTLMCPSGHVTFQLPGRVRSIIPACFIKVAKLSKYFMIFRVILFLFGFPL